MMLRRDFLKTIAAVVAGGSAIVPSPDAPKVCALHPLMRLPSIRLEVVQAWWPSSVSRLRVEIERNIAEPDWRSFLASNAIINTTNRRIFMGAGPGQLLVQSVRYDRLFEEWEGREVKYWRHSIALLHNPEGWGMRLLVDGRWKLVDQPKRSEFPKMLELCA